MSAVPISKYLAAAGVQLQKRDESLLIDLFLSGALTRDQIMSLGYFQSIQRGNSRLLKLGRAGLVARPQWGRIGAGQAVYVVGPAAAELISRALDRPLATIADEIRQPTSLATLSHTLTVTDMRIAFVNGGLPESVAGVRWVSERAARHDYSICAGGGTWKGHSFRPDGAVIISTEPSKVALFVEADLGTVGSAKFEQKIASYLNYERGVFTETYGLPNFTALVVTSGPKRLEHLRTLAKRQGASLLRFATFEQFWANGPFGPIWTGVRGNDVFPLLDSEQLRGVS